MGIPPEPEIGWSLNDACAMAASLREDESRLDRARTRVQRGLTRAERVRHLEERHTIDQELLRQALSTIRQQNRVIEVLLNLPAVVAELKNLGYLSREEESVP